MSTEATSLANLIAAVEKKFQIRCRELRVDKVEIEDDGDVAELKEGDQSGTYDRAVVGMYVSANFCIELQVLFPTFSPLPTS